MYDVMTFEIASTESLVCHLSIDNVLNYTFTFFTILMFHNFKIKFIFAKEFLVCKPDSLFRMLKWKVKYISNEPIFSINSYIWKWKVARK